MNELEFAELRSVLMKLLGLPAKKAELLRGRLDHFRKMGVPKLPKLGSGRRTQYTFADGFELLIALRLERIDCPPRKAKVGAKVARGQVTNSLQQESWYLLYDPDEGFTAGDMLQRDNFLNLLHECIVVDLSKSAKELYEAWREELAKRE